LLDSSVCLFLQIHKKQDDETHALHGMTVTWSTWKVDITHYSDSDRLWHYSLL
jgi:hypothetical protein